jgi:pterin-4a-carbinolamine dehydratase
MLENIIRKRIQESKENRSLVSQQGNYDSFIESPIQIKPAQWENIEYSEMACLERTFEFDDPKLFLFFLMEVYKLGIKHLHYPDLITSDLTVTIRLYTKNINDVTDIDFELSKEIIDVYSEIDFIE